MKPADSKTLYWQYYAQKYREFTLSSKKEKDKVGSYLRIPAPSWLPWFTTSGETDVFSKYNIPCDSDDNTLQMVKKNDKPHAFLWTSTPEKIKQGVRWGIVKSESITGQVISTLGHYRMRATERVSHGMVSDTQGIKIALLDIYQDRFEALQDLESLVNKNNDITRYKDTIEAYKKDLLKIRAEVKNRFSKLHLKELGYASLTDKIIADIDEDIRAADVYFRDLQRKRMSLSSANRARGNNSILEFVKQQMHRNLYEVQGLNQGVVFSVGALSRGELNDYIEDARKVIDDHQPDLRDPVTKKHHGDFTDKFDEDKKITYEFSLDELTLEQEREALLAVSFIEGWDSVDYVKSTVHNNRQNNKEKEKSARLIKISATKWNTHRNVGRAIWEYATRWVTGIVYRTKAWHEGVTDTGNFELYANTLAEHTRTQDPLWMKGLYFLRDIVGGIKIIATGVYNAGMHLVFNLFEDIEKDWNSSLKLPTWEVLREKAEREIRAISIVEEKQLEDVFKEAKHEKIEDQLQGDLGTLAQVEYHLVSGEDRDVLTAVAQGVGGFIEHFTHELFAKDPVGGLFFTSGFVVGGACILFPDFTKTYFLPAYVKGFGSFAKLVGSSTSSQALCGGFMQAQAGPLVWNAITDGPNSKLAHGFMTFMANPIPTTIGFLAAYGVGYALANLPVPYLHELIKNELGSSEILNYPVIGIKFGIMSVMLVYADEANGYTTVEIPYVKIDKMVTRLISEKYEDDLETAAEKHKLHERFLLLRWLNSNASMLPKLNATTRFDLIRQIDKLFERDEALSLHKLIIPEEERSIGYQLFAVPLGYIPAIFRLGSSVVSSALAFITENPNYWEPVKEASAELLRKMSKDINRLNVASGRFLRGITSFVVSNFKALFLVTNMLIERIAAFDDDYRPGHSMYKDIAYPFHAIYSAIGEFFYPVRAMKSVVSADPSATAHAMLSSYEGLMKELGVDLNEHKKVANVDRIEKQTIETKSVVIPIVVENDKDYSNEDSRRQVFI